MGRPFVYEAAFSKEEFEEQITRVVLQGLLRQSSRPVVNTFFDLVKTDEDLLAELEELIQEKSK